MEKLFNNLSMVIGAVGGVIVYWLGGWDILLKTILFLAVIDYITGILKAIHQNQLSPRLDSRG